MDVLRIKNFFICGFAVFPISNINCFSQQRPNILWLTYEDTSPYFVGCYGNEDAHTPVMDDLAENGIRFDNAFSTGTVSSPSRFCLITGCKPGKFGTGNHRSNYQIPSFIHGFPEFLRRAGYYTTNNSKTDYNHKMHRAMTRESWDESSGKASWRGRKPGQPFFAVFNSGHSHQSRTMTNPWEVYKEQVLYKLDKERILSVDDKFEMPPFYCDTPDMRKQVSRIYNSISLTDQHFGEILKELDKDGLRDSTIIFCFADHGEGMPRGKGSALGNGYKVPFILWIPEMYKHLTPWGSGVITDELVGFDDFGATVLSLAGVQLPDYIEGTPFLPYNEKREKQYVFGSCDAVDNNIEVSRSVIDGQYVYTRVFTNYQPFVRWISYYDHADIQKLMRRDYKSNIMNDLQKEIMEPRVVEYLYDLKADKWETKNLAFLPEYKEKVTELRLALKQHLIETKDVNFIPEYTLSLEEQRNIIPYDLRQDVIKYPINEVIETAMLCGMGENVIQEQLNRITHENDIVSYWAAIGLFSQREKLIPYIKQLKSCLDVVNYAPARIWLAASILNIENSDKAYDVLNGYLLDKNDYLAIYSMNALLEMNIDVAKQFVHTLNEQERIYDNNKKRPGVISMMNVTRLRLEGKDFRFASFW